MQAVATAIIQTLHTVFWKTLTDCISCTQCVTAYPPVEMVASSSPWFLLAIHASINSVCRSRLVLCWRARVVSAGVFSRQAAPQKTCHLMLRWGWSLIWKAVLSEGITCVGILLFLTCSIIRSLIPKLQTLLKLERGKKNQTKPKNKALCHLEEIKINVLPH